MVCKQLVQATDLETANNTSLNSGIMVRLIDDKFATTGERGEPMALSSTCL